MLGYELEFRVMNDAQPVVRVEGLTKHYGERRVLDGVSLEVYPGARIAIRGPSGSGKSTLLNCLGGVDRADAGRVWIAGMDLGILKADAVARLRREVVSTIFQFFHLLPTLTAAENIEFPLQLLGVEAKARVDRVNRLLEEVRLTHRAAALPEELSGGEMQRVAIARALAPEPRLLLADEPTGNLDSATGRAILDLLHNVCTRRRSALLLVTHSEEAAAICDRVLDLRDGRLLDPPEGLEK